MEKISVKYGSFTEEINPKDYINPGEWRGSTWCITSPYGILGVVEADTAQDALDTFVDARPESYLTVDDADIDEDTTFAGNESRPVDLSDTSIRRCSVNWAPVR